MSTNKHIDRICAVVTVLALVITIVFMNGVAFGIEAQAKTIGYEDRLFDTSKVHSIDLVIDDWDTFLSTAQSEEYSVCNVAIDGESISKVGIRAKGNTSLTTVASMDSDRYSFKIEFDHYDSSKSYHGLDKLSLNNLIQDNTMMKDYLTYQLMNEFGVAAPLCSYVYITINGEDWGLYLAVEAVEESFLQRNYGNAYGELYKPDSTNMGGGRGNGMNFDFADFMEKSDAQNTSTEMPTMGGNFDPTQMGGKGFGGGFGADIDEETLRSAFEELGLDTALLDGIDFENITMENIQSVLSSLGQDAIQKLMEAFMGENSFDKAGGAGRIDMGSSETKLQYIDDDPDSYSAIFSSAKTNVTEADQARLIASLKTLSEGDASALDVEAVMRYFVVHNYVVNADSYTGSMIHNYYLYEEDGKLSMIPWDYNLAFGTFQGKQATTAVNDDIDSPLSVTGSDRPMIDWIFASEEYTELYHQYFAEFLENVDIASIISQAEACISAYVEKDPTKFCTYEEYEKGVQTLREFCTLRSESVASQLAGETKTIDASAIDLSDMGTMNNGIGGGNGAMPTMGGDRTEAGEGTVPDERTNGTIQMPDGQGGMQMPDGQGGMQMPNGQGGMQMPNGQGGMQMPNGQDGTQTPDRQEGIELPSGDEFLDKQNGKTQGGFPDRDQSTTSSAGGNTQWVLLAVTVVLLIAGLLFAIKFKR